MPTIGKSGAVVLSSQEHENWSLQVQANYLKFESFSFTGEEMAYVSDGMNQVYNYPYGAYVYVPGGEVTFESCDFTKLYHPLYSQCSGLRVVGCKFHDSIENCQIDENQQGRYLVGAKKQDEIRFINSPMKKRKS